MITILPYLEYYKNSCIYIVVSFVIFYLNMLVGCQGDSYQTERTNSVSGVSTDQLTRHATVKKNMNRSVFL